MRVRLIIDNQSVLSMLRGRACDGRGGTVVAVVPAMDRRG